MISDSMAIAEEFGKFVNAPVVEPRKAIAEAIFRRVRKDLNPSPIGTFVKMAFIHVLVGCLTLTLCPQFGIGLLPGFGVMDLLNRFGEHVCMFGCGLVFLGTSAFVMSLLLSPEEMRHIKGNGVLHFLSLTFLSLGFFAFTSHELSILISAIWTAGSMFGSLILFRLGWKLRTFFRRKIAYGI